MRTLNAVNTVVFDCDSTLCDIEGIDELGSEIREQIEALTSAAMHGDVPLEAVYGRRLDLIRPSRERVDRLGRQYVASLVPDAAAVVRTLQECNIVVRIMSGGLLPAVMAVADALGISAHDVAAVDVHFDESGGYTGYDTHSPLTRSGGKRDLLAAWRPALEGRVMMVGDGATDIEAAEVADVFVAYAGVVERAPVVAAADAVVHSASLAPVVPLALGGVRPADESARELYDRGMSLLDEQCRNRLSDLNR